MSTHAVTLELPEPLYALFRDRAERTRRPVEEEILELVSAAATAEADLTGDLTDAVEGLAVLDDEALWRAARTEVPVASRSRLSDLTLRKEAEGLEPSEQASLEQMLRAADRVMLVRARAAGLLRERGHDVSALGPG
ncbi:MAG: hypothetical protein MI919_21290 [Holophagales bacterium]|nr:hypothetical protein [Holophagales bacterium]